MSGLEATFEVPGCRSHKHPTRSNRCSHHMAPGLAHTGLSKVKKFLYAIFVQQQQLNDTSAQYAKGV